MINFNKKQIRAILKLLESSIKESSRPIEYSKIYLKSDENNLLSCYITNSFLVIKINVINNNKIAKKFNNTSISYEDLKVWLKNNTPYNPMDFTDLEKLIKKDSGIIAEKLQMIISRDNTNEQKSLYKTKFNMDYLFMISTITKIKSICFNFINDQVTNQYFISIKDEIRNFEAMLCPICIYESEE